ncbi:MAG: NRDE family protein [Lutibacter sp.]|uniref:NRDE family protein n=1 Tax=Lutibacter sp. TaxID=1925666 RepID=UPI00385F2321
MCTVTFFPLNDRVVLTSNRDEKTNRPTLSPKTYQFDETKLLFPKDKKAGGTWFVAKEDGTVIILLNGAFENHRKKIGYAKSRGIVLLEVIKAKKPLEFYKKMNLEGIEPFTLIYFFEDKLIEMKWDEEQKHIYNHAVTQNHIWSSATLYSKEQRESKKKRFDNFIHDTYAITENKILNFHQKTQLNNKEYDFIINRRNILKTVSITQISIQNKSINMKYVDVENTEIFENIKF